MNTLVSIIQNSKSSFGGKTALQIRQDETYFKLSYQQLHDDAQAVGHGLKDFGIKKGDTLGILTENSPLWGVAFFGIAFAGATVIPLDSKLKEHSIAYIIQHSECKAVFVSSKLLDLLHGACQTLSTPPKIIRMDLTASPEGALSLGNLIREGQGQKNKLNEKTQPEDLAIILYTSGTTGLPKGVMLTHANLTSNVESVASLFPFGDHDQFVCVLPLCHTYAITADFLIGIHCGATITYVENLKGPVLVERMQENKATVLISVPALIQLMYHSIKSKLSGLSGPKKWIFNILRSLSRICLPFNFIAGRTLFKSVWQRLSPHLQFFISGGAPIDPKLIEELFILGIPVYQGYGLTETSPILTVNTPTHNRIGSVGRSIPGVQIKLENGEILARGPNIMKGYYKNEAATQDVLKDGWFHTGDLGRWDSDGFLYITGRLKNVIVTRGGKNVSPEEIEEELGRNPWVKESCVVGLKKDSKGFSGDEQVYALVVPNAEPFTQEGINLKENLIHDSRVQAKIADVIKSANERLADYKWIRGFELWDELPKTTTLKIKRKEIMEILQKKGATPHHIPQS